jgi:hypothetical protein
LTEVDGGGYLRYNSADQSTLFIGADGGNLDLYDKLRTGEGVRIRERVVDGKRYLYYQEDGTNRAPVSTDELVNRRIMAAYVSADCAWAYVFFVFSP